MKKKSCFWHLCVFGVVAVFFLATAPTIAKPHRNVWLKNAVGHKIQPDRNATEPYSPRRTCGTCHGYSTITYGYHFQMGFTEISDNFNREKPWLVSPGMYGKWCPAASRSGQAARKNNLHEKEIDLALYDWIGMGKTNPKLQINVPACATCHPGGGALEFPRKADGTADFSRDLIEAEFHHADSLDGDFFSRATPDRKSHFRESGLLEADCMLCHAAGYQIAARTEQILARNYRWAATAGAGLGTVDGKILTYSNPGAAPDAADFWKGEWNFEKRPVVDYKWTDSRLFTADGMLKGTLLSKSVKSENCLQCHQGADTKKVGWLHDPKYDAHVKAGFECTDCHGLVGRTSKERLQHQIAKGWHPVGSVRDDLDGAGMKTCEWCHVQGNYKPNRPGLPEVAKNPQASHAAAFADVEFHLEMIACTACHNTRQPARGSVLIDMAAGSQIWYTASDFEATIWPKDFGSLAAAPWQPWVGKLDLRGGDEARYIPLVPKVIQWFGEKNAQAQIQPIRLALVKKAFWPLRNQITQVKVTQVDGKTVAKPTVATDADILLMLKALRQLGFKSPVFVADQVYELKAGELNPYEDAPATHSYDFSIHHNVVALTEKTVLGHAGAPEGCADCHSATAPFFSKMKIKNIGKFLQNYPQTAPPWAVPMYEEVGLDEVPQSGFEE
jgi:hypothetical protein